MLLHIFAEERRIGETKHVTYLLDAVVGLFQVVADVFEYMFRYPFIGGLTRMLLANR